MRREPKVLSVVQREQLDTGPLKYERLKASGIEEFVHRHGSRDEAYRHGWRHFTP